MKEESMIIVRHRGRLHLELTMFYWTLMLCKS